MSFWNIENDHIRGLPDRIMKALAGYPTDLPGTKSIVYNTRFRPPPVWRMRAPVLIGLWLPWFTILVMAGATESLGIRGGASKALVSEEIVWVIEKHGLFQAYYYAHHGDRHAR